MFNAPLLKTSLLSPRACAAEVRGALTRWVKSLWGQKGVRYGVFAVLALDTFYLVWIIEALRSPLYNSFLSPIEMEFTCELTMCAAL